MTDILFDPNRLPFFNHARPVAKGTLSFHEFAVETAADEVFLMQADSMIVYVNEAACNTLGYTKDELIGMCVWEWDPLFPKTAWSGFWDEFVQAKHLHFETRHKTKQGLIFPVEIHAHLYQENDELFLLAFVNDLSAVKAIEAKKFEVLEEANATIDQERLHLKEVNKKSQQIISKQDQRLKELWENSPSTYLVLGFRDMDILECNKSAERYFQIDRSNLIGKKVKEISNPYQQDGELSELKLKQIRDEAIRKGNYQFEWVCQRNDGQPLMVDVVITVGELDGGYVFFSTWHDIGRVKNLESQLKSMIYMDQLTNLFNRQGLEEYFPKVIARSERTNKDAYLMFVDLDNFKYVNDAFGHEMGDILLKLFAKKLKNILRKEDFIARIGGDEFAVVVERIDKSSDMVKIANQILTVFKEPVEIEQQHFLVSLSIGIACYSQDGNTFDDLLSRADIAMYQAKASGKGRYHFYSKRMEEDSSTRIETELKLRKALTENQLRMFYQPLLNLRTGGLAGVESLIRWIDPDEGLRSPDEFLPVAMESSLIEEIERWVFWQTCHQAKVWKDAGVEFGKIAVNLTPRALQNRYAVRLLSEAMQETGCPAECLEVEISENFLLINQEQGLAELAALCDLGVTLSLDDFGTGYSSLTYVKKMPLNKLKIDRSFIQNLMVDANDREIVSATLAMSKKLGLEVVAEGVEYQNQVDFLKAENCDLIQGYWVSEAIPAPQMEELFKERFVTH